MQHLHFYPSPITYVQHTPLKRHVQSYISPCYPFQLQQKDHYDRRTQVDKEAKGQQYASTLLEKALARGPTTSRDTSQPGPSHLSQPTMSGDTSQPGPSHLSQPTIASDSEEDLDTPGVGDMVAIVLPGSTLAQPMVKLGEGAAYQRR